MKPLVIFGTGTLACLMLRYIEDEGERTVAAFSVDEAFIEASSIKGFPVVNFEKLPGAFPASEYDMLIAVGYANMRAREAVFNRIRGSGYRLINFVPEQSGHPESMGDNNIVMPGARIEPFSKLGDNNLIWSGAHVCHHTVIGNHNFLAANSTTGGNVRIGNGCFLGFGSVIIQDLKIADETLIGAGAVVLQDTDSHGKYVGNPARKVDSHEESGIRIPSPSGSADKQ